MRHLSLALSVLALAGVGEAAATTCYLPSEIEADQAIKLRAELKVVGEVCKDPSYAIFSDRNRDTLAAYEQILGYTPRLLFASFLAYLVGEFANAFVLAKMKIATRGRWLWSRLIGSTVVGQGLDSLVFIPLAFAGAIPLPALISAIVTQWALKVLYEAAATPLTYGVVSFLKRREGLDVYDHGTRFNPLVVTE